jgi:hypothetical protein
MALVISSAESEIVVRNRNDEFFAYFDDIADASATSLRNALRAADARSEPVTWSGVERSLFDSEYSPAEPVSLSLDRRGELTLDASFFIDEYADESDQSEKIKRLLTKGVVPQSRGIVSTVEPDPHYAASPWLWHVKIQPAVRGRSLRDLRDLGLEAIALAEAASGGVMDRGRVVGLLRGQYAGVLVGQPESAWLDVKSQSYDVSIEAGKIALAQAVARFANGDQGGLVIVGMATRATQSGEVIRKVTPIPSEPRLVRRYWQALERHLFPLPDGLVIETVDRGTGMLIFLDLPSQQEELKPFLVHGAITGHGIEGAFISILRRQGEHSIPITAPAIHAQLSAGRALLRRGELPKSERGVANHGHQND